MIGLVDGNNFFVSCERVVNPALNGKPVAVLSNNDGCCVSRSNEFKALGIQMGTPYFQLRDREFPRGDLRFCSSNFELYGDLSRRIISILRDLAIEVEQYSIDEAFIWPPTTALDNLLDYGRCLRARILQWVGIPCGVGFAPTKTLAKIANHIGKKTTGGVYILPDNPSDILAALPVDEVWGVGRRLPVKLRAERIFTAKDLRDASEEVIRSIGGVTLLRTALELRGISTQDAHDYDADPQSVTCSRMFGEQVTTEEALLESLASFTAQAAVKLRRHGLLASGCNVYAQLASVSKDFLGQTVVFPEPTDATNVMMKAIRTSAAALFVRGAHYRKSGVVLFGLEKANAVRQLDLFTDVKHESSSLYRTIDALNARFGAGRVMTASEGLGQPAWKMRRDRLSRRMTTNWNELLVVR